MKKGAILTCIFLFIGCVHSSRRPVVLSEPPLAMLPAPLLEVLPDTVEIALFDEAVDCIKHFEGWHGPKHYPYVGYGHKLLPGENFTSDISLETADSLLRADLLRKCSMFREFGKDSLLLGVLAYNVGEYRLLGLGSSIPKSRLIQKLENGDRNIYEEYVSFRKYKGQVISSIENRRETEYALLFDKTFIQIIHPGI